MKYTIDQAKGTIKSILNMLPRVNYFILNLEKIREVLYNVNSEITNNHGDLNSDCLDGNLNYIRNQKSAIKSILPKNKEEEDEFKYFTGNFKYLITDFKIMPGEPKATNENKKFFEKYEWDVKSFNLKLSILKDFLEELDKYKSKFIKAKNRN
ncbi:MAG: hypothetical protein KAW40_04790 [Candidatus Aenigmarchaeota archaeon]|nr:hypothetical protein [Candidatus Aenigmarchaeota archaeon]